MSAELVCSCPHPPRLHGQSGCTACDCPMVLPDAAPGVYRDYPASEYHRLPYVGSTFLKAFRECPAKALLPRDPTDAMILGQAAHAYVLEGQEAFDRDFVVMFESELNKNTNEYKKLKANFLEANQDRTILPSHYKQVPAMELLAGINESVRSHPFAGLLLNGGDGLQEVSLVWDDHESGLRCKARIDRDPGRKTIVELKMCSDIERFTRQIGDLNYDIQCGHYVNGSLACKVEVDTSIFVAVQPEPPYIVRCVPLSEDYLDWSKHEAKRLLRLVAQCREKDYFPRFSLHGMQSLDDITPYQVLDDPVEKPAWRN